MWKLQSSCNEAMSIKGMFSFSYFFFWAIQIAKGASGTSEIPEIKPITINNGKLIQTNAFNELQLECITFGPEVLIAHSLNKYLQSLLM